MAKDFLIGFGLCTPTLKILSFYTGVVPRQSFIEP